MGFRNFLYKRSFVDMDYVYGTLSHADGENPLDYPALRDNSMELWVVATDAAAESMCRRAVLYNEGVALAQKYAGQGSHDAQQIVRFIHGKG